MLLEHKVIKLNQNEPNNILGQCLDCDWEDEISKAHTDYEWDDFKGNEVPYLICPKCSGGVEIT